MNNTRLRLFFHRFARWHAGFALGLVGMYIVSALFYSPEFFLADIRDRMRAFADDTIAITATVVAPPATPIVTAVSQCDTGTGVLLVALDWGNDTGTDSWDITRDSSPLVSGVTQSQYSDTTVALSTTYTYQVTAYGPMGPGTTVSDPVTVTTLDVCEHALPSPSVGVTKLNHHSVSDDETTNRRPLFEGKTNIPSANIALTVHGSQVISAEITANSGGYWNWRPSTNLSYGDHTINITATDPHDSSRTVSDSFSFTIEKPAKTVADRATTEASGSPSSVTYAISSATSNLVSTGTSTSTKTPVADYPLSDQTILPLAFTLVVESPTIIQGEHVRTSLAMTALDTSWEGADAVVRYAILDMHGDEVASQLETITLLQGPMITHTIVVPKYLQEGSYRVQATVIVGVYSVSREVGITVLPKPLLHMGGGTVVTYPVLLHHMGTMALSLFATCLLWLVLFAREYWLAMHTLRRVTEEQLARIGLFGMRKGVRH